MADRDPDYVDGEDDESDDEEVGGKEARGATKRERPKRQRAAAARSSLEWQCVRIVNEDDEVNPFVHCKYCPWKSGAGATRIGITYWAAGRQPSAKVAAKSTNR